MIDKFHVVKVVEIRSWRGKCRDWAFENTTFNILYSYMKENNIASRATAIANGMCKVDEFVDGDGEITTVYAVTREKVAKLHEM